ncbi:hypothetical protein OCGS_0245 [Oceaniovalibus guishaninsula JLT2003]|uniref:Tryptophan synthase subunit beta n=1 Tax=Oceaniovalibus guishaninsula JLT2003 TaxID=1231392 RepID=K2HDT1_9RHOB|nr:hypothetical protein [Oceaniovalibus guishaninsula]EKE45628.1 hypothetical protein OCGS_0245 [Oceaniovalibus guishaninsula JLT2003]
MTQPDKEQRRIARQFAAITDQVPPSRRMVQSLLTGRLRWARIPLGLLLVVGGFAAILPVFGLWMIPLGLLVLAVDVPFLRPLIGHTMVRMRLWWRNLRRRR